MQKRPGFGFVPNLPFGVLDTIRCAEGVPTGVQGTGAARPTGSASEGISQKGNNLLPILLAIQQSLPDCVRAFSH